MKKNIKKKIMTWSIEIKNAYTYTYNYDVKQNVESCIIIKYRNFS